MKLMDRRGTLINLNRVCAVQRYMGGHSKEALKHLIINFGASEDKVYDYSNEKDLVYDYNSIDMHLRKISGDCSCSTVSRSTTFKE